MGPSGNSTTPGGGTAHRRPSLEADVVVRILQPAGDDVGVLLEILAGLEKGGLRALVKGAYGR